MFGPLSLKRLRYESPGRMRDLVPTENSIALKNRDRHAIGEKFLGFAKALGALPRVVREMPHRRLGAGAEDHQACGVYVERMPGLLTPPVVRNEGRGSPPAGRHGFENWTLPERKGRQEESSPW
jgi:hypothetical protein